MGSKSPIEWLDGGATWNFLYGCTKASDGCRHCYAERVVPRLTGKIPPGASYQGKGNVIVSEERIDVPKSWTKPRKIFVNSLSDTFHESVPDALLDRAWDVMEETPRHTYIVLTKRPERMREYLFSRGYPWMMNVWVGTSAEDERTLRARLAHLEITPAEKRILSLEPLLGPIDLDAQLVAVDWVIVGGESGRLPRPCEEKWIRAIVRSCKEQGVPVYVKQMGTAWANEVKGMQPCKIGGKGQDIALWPKDLQVREVPR